MKKRKEKQGSKKKCQILIENQCQPKRPPFSNFTIVKIVKKVMYGEDCYSFNIGINLVKNGEIKRINNKFLNHNYYTDVITFTYQNCSSNLEGEIFISLSVVKRNSIIYSDSYKREFIRVLLHGCLHLAGYNDSSRLQKELIRKKENFYMSGIGKVD